MKIYMQYIFLYFHISSRNIIRNIYITIKESVLIKNNTYKKWVNYNIENFKIQSIDLTNKLIFCDVFMIPEWLFINSFALNNISSKSKCCIVSFGSNPRSKVENQIYSSFGAKYHFQIKLKKRELIIKHRELFFFAKKNIKTKEDLFNFKIDGIHIGIDIYESILRTGLSTVNLNSFISWLNIFIGLEYFVFFEDFLKKEKIESFVLSHDNYIYMGIPSKLGYRYNIPTYLFNTKEFIKLTRPNELHDRFKNFPAYFEKLTEQQKQSAIIWSKDQLNRRLSGQIGVEMSYQQKSAFTKEKISSQVLNNGNLNIVVATHEFYDNPHCYGGLLFLDFYDWLIYLGDFSKTKKYNFYIKPHRDVVNSEIIQLNKICKLFPNFILLNENYTFHQLIDEGVKIALTCYGSIGHELPLLGYTVVNAGNNPHMAYNFNINPETIDEYNEVLNTLEIIELEINRNEIYEFFYTYNKILYSFDFSIKNQIKTKFENTNDIYLNFLFCSENYKKDIQELLNEFLESNTTYSFLLKY